MLGHLDMTNCPSLFLKIYTVMFGHLDIGYVCMSKCPSFLEKKFFQNARTVGHRDDKETELLSDKLLHKCSDIWTCSNLEFKYSIFLRCRSSRIHNKQTAYWPLLVLVYYFCSLK